MPRLTSITLAFAALLLLATARADPSPEQLAHFEKKIRPVLVEHCVKCHSADAAKAGKLKGGLALDTRDGLRAGGESGPAIVPGKPADSLVIKTLRHA